MRVFVCFVCLSLLSIAVQYVETDWPFQLGKPRVCGLWLVNLRVISSHCIYLFRFTYLRYRLRLFCSTASKRLTARLSVVFDINQSVL